MYDTLSLSIEPSDIVFNKLLNSLDNPKPKRNLHTGINETTGHLANMRVWFCDTFPQKLKITGSLAKFHYGDNLQKLTRSETEQAIQKLSETLTVDMKQAKVQRLDIGANFVLSKPCAEYQACLGEIPRMKRSTLTSAQGEGVYFQNSKRTLAIYNKVKDCQKLRQPIPEVFQGRHVLRYELRYMKNISAQLKLQTVTAQDLYSEIFYIDILNRWRDCYFSINKNEGYRMRDDIDIEKPKDLINYFAAIGIQQLGGTGKVLELLKVSQQSGKLTKQRAYSLRNKVHEITTIPKLVEPNNSIKELDSKVEKATAHYR